MSAARFWPARRRARRFQPRLRRRASQRFRATREICLGAGARPCGSTIQTERWALVRPDRFPHVFGDCSEPRIRAATDPWGHLRAVRGAVLADSSALERRQPIAFAERLRRDVVPCTLSDGRIRAASAARCRNRSPETRCAALSTKTCKRLPKRCCNSDARSLIAATKA